MNINNNKSTGKVHDQIKINYK